MKESAVSEYGPFVSPEPFDGGQLPSEYAEAASLPTVRRLLAEQVDMQFADMRALLRLPLDDVAPNIGCNLTMAAAILNQISGFSVWFFHTRYAQQLSKKEAHGRGMRFSRRRFLGFVRAYYPRAVGEPQSATIATRLYETRNVLAHELGIGELGRNRRRHDVLLVKPDPPLEASDVVDLEIHAQFPLAGAPVTLRGSAVRLYLPGHYWALGRMLRAALADQPIRCERLAEEFIKALPVPRASK